MHRARENSSRALCYSKLLGLVRRPSALRAFLSPTHAAPGYSAVMSPATGEYLLFLHSTRHRKGQPIYEAIDLTPWAEHQPGEWSGWLACGSDAPEEVMIVTPHFDIIHSTGSDGSYWSIDGERVPQLGPDEEMRAQVETHATIGFSPPRLVPLPAFVSRRKPSAPAAIQSAVVRLENSVAAFSDAILNHEVLDAISLDNDPELTKILGENFASSARARSARRWDKLCRTKVPLGTMVPAEVVCDEGAVGCVVRLDRHAGDPAGTDFECTLFLAATAPVAPGTLLRRRSGLWPPGRPPRLLERVVGTVVSAEPPQPLPSAPPTSAPGDAASSVQGLELRCLSCGARHPARRFDAEAIAVAELTALWHEHWKELALLRRTAALYRKHPAARGYVKSDHDWIMNSEDPVVQDQLMSGMPFDQITPPRPPDYEARVDRWLADDPELREFLESCSFDLEARTQFTSESEQKYRDQLRGRSVPCPACRDGLLALANSEDD